MHSVYCLIASWAKPGSKAAIVQGQPRLSSKGNPAYPLPISSKNHSEAWYKRNMPLWFKPYSHLNHCNPSNFKVFSLLSPKIKWPHRKDISSLQGHLNLLYSLSGAIPDCPHWLFGGASGYIRYSNSSHKNLIYLISHVLHMCILAIIVFIRHYSTFSNFLYSKCTHILAYCTSFATL